MNNFENTSMKTIIFIIFLKFQKFFRYFENFNIIWCLFQKIKNNFKKSQQINKNLTFGITDQVVESMFPNESFFPEAEN